MVVILGPTGVGKSDFAELLASYANGELVNMDIGQCYVPLTIGTAKPDWKHAKITHHLFDIIDTPIDFTVVAYRSILLDTLKTLWSIQKLPIVVGGSSFYLKSILFPPVSDVAIHVAALAEHTHDNSWEELYEIDPIRAQQIDKNDSYRIERALDIWRKTGKKPSIYKPTPDIPCDMTILFLTRDRQELYERINARVHVMFDQGWIDEVAQLKGTDWEPFLYHKKLIGYNEILDYLSLPEEERDEKTLISSIQQRTRHYAKRQETFWRSLTKNLDDVIAQNKTPHTITYKTVNLTLLDVDLYIKHLLDELLGS